MGAFLTGSALAAAGSSAGGASWLGPAIGAGAGLVGDIFGAASQANMNLANRQWSAQQADLNRQFQASQTKEVQDWETQMSNTAEQRRVADLKSAGLNPLLAMGGPGPASQPSVSPPSGSMASAQTAAPGAAFGNLGAQVSSALQLQALNSQIAKASADARYTNAQTDEVIPQQVKNLQASYDLTRAQATVAANTVKWATDQAYYSMESARSQMDIQQQKDIIANLDRQTQQAIQQELIRATNAQNRAAAAEGKVQTTVTEGAAGQLLEYLNRVLKPVATAAQVAAHF